MPRTPSTGSRSAAAAPPKKVIYGIPEARLFPPPLRPLSRATSRGYDIIDFAEAIGQPLLPWQQWLVKHAFEINRDGTYRFRVVIVLVARQNGKSHLMRIITLWRMLYDEDCRLILGTAQDLSQAANQWKLTLALAEGTPALRRRLDKKLERHVNGQEAFGFINGAEYMVRSANPNAGRGFSVDGLILDEIRTHHDSKAWSALYYTTMARPNPMTFAVSNAGDEESVVLNQLRDAALSGRDDTIGLFEWSGEDGCALDDLRAWRQANPGLGHTVSLAAIRTACALERPEVFRTEVLCQKVDQLDGAIDLAAWKASADPAGSMDAYRDRIAACFDVAPDGRHATLAVAALQSDGRIRIEIAWAWTTSDQARSELAGWLAKIRPAALGWYPGGPGGELGPLIRPQAIRINKHGGKREPTEIPEDGAIAGTKVAEACQGLAGLVKGRQIVHAGQDLLDAHVQFASKLPSGDGWRFTRKGEGHVDAAYAAAGAVYLVQTMPPPRRAAIRLVG